MLKGVENSPSSSIHACTIFPRIKAQASISFWTLFDLPSKQGWPDTGLASVCTCSSRRGFLQVLFSAVRGSKLKSDIIAISLG